MKNTSKILALVLVLMMMFAMTSMFTASAESAGETWSVVGPLTGGWDAGAAPEMTYDEATGAYVLVLYNVAAGKYEYKVIKDKKWGVKEYPSSGNYSVEIKENGSTVTVKLLNNTVTVEQEVPAPCEHDFSAGNICLESVKCSKCDVHSGIPKAHIYGTDTVCDNCGFDHTQTHKVYFKNTPNWATVTVHNWSDAGGGTTWPGSLATKEGDFYVFEIPAGRDMCIFNNNGQGSQTANLLVPAEPMVYNFETQKWEELPHTHNFVEGRCECGEEDPNYVPPHVNALVVGDTNKIVVSGATLNDYGLPIEWVPFVADENAFYSFVGDNSALAFIFTAEGALVSATGAANLEAGTYLICLGNGVAGEFNVAVTKSAWVNALAIGDNKILITDTLDNGYGYYIVWVPFEVTEKANYTFTGEGILPLVYDAANQAVTGTELEVGTYNVCIAFLTPATTGVATVKVEKTAIEQGGEDGPVEGPTHDGEQKVVLGDNTIVIDGCTSNLSGTAIEWLTFVVEEAGTYVVSSADLNCFIYDESKNLASLDACLCGFTGTAVLEPGTYYLCVGNAGVTGEFTVNIKLDNEAVVHKNTLVVGDNKYIITDALHTAGFELNVTIEITEPGTYVVTGGAPMKVYFWYILGESTGNNFASNMDGFSETGLADSFTVTITEAGTYYMGFNYEYVTDEREFDINISLKEVEDPKPEDPKPEDPKPEEPKDEAPEMNFFEKIIAWFMDLLQKLLAMFKK